MIRKLQDWLIRRNWKRMSDTEPMRGVLRCHVCNWEDTFWADGKMAAAKEAEERIRGHIMFTHGEEMAESPFKGLL